MSKSKIGGQVEDVFSKKGKQQTVHKKEEDKPEESRRVGRPKVHKKEVLKTVITIRKDQLIWLDQLALDIRSESDEIIDRGCLIRAFIDAVNESGLEFKEIHGEEDAKEIILAKLKKK